MTALEKIFHDRLNRPDATSGVDEEALWADIAGALPAAADAPSPAWWRSAGWLSGTALVLLLGVVALVWWPSAEPVAEGSSVEVRTAENDPVKETTPATSTAPSFTRPAPAPRRPDATAKQELNTDATKQGAAAGAIKVREAKEEQPPFAAITNTISQEPSEPSELSPLSFGERLGERRTSMVKTIDFLPPTIINPVSHTRNLTLKLNQLAQTPKQIKPIQKNRYHLTATTGGNLLHRQYQGNSESPADDLNKANRVATGLTTSLEAGYRIGQHWTVATGLTCQRTISAFEHTVETDTTIAHPSPLNSGQINAVARQRTAHNHRLRFLSIPLTISRDWTFGDFSAGLGAGVAINWLQSATGKTINSDGLVAAYGAEQSGTAKTFMSYHLRPELSWRFDNSKRTELVLQTQTSYQNLGVSPLSGVKQNGWLLSVSLGLKRSF